MPADLAAYLAGSHDFAADLRRLADCDAQTTAACEALVATARRLQDAGLEPDTLGPITLAATMGLIAAVPILAQALADIAGPCVDAEVACPVREQAEDAWCDACRARVALLEARRALDGVA